MSRYDSDPAKAEAELMAASNEHSRLDDDLENARETLEDFEDQLAAAEGDADKEHLTSVIAVVESEIDGLEQDLREAAEELTRKNDFWFGSD